MEEVGIYRVSGVATDIQGLKAAFDASEYLSSTQNRLSYWCVKVWLISLCSADNKDVSVMMSEMDVNAIAGTLKLYFRELPEPLFTDELYANFTEGIGLLFSWCSCMSESLVWNS